MESLITTYGEAKDIIRKDLESMSKKFITIGYYLKYIRDKKLYIQDGFESIWEFAQDTYGISKSTCSRWIHMNDKFRGWELSGIKTRVCFFWEKPVTGNAVSGR